jgi:hypothetical protein
MQLFKCIGETIQFLEYSKIIIPEAALCILHITKHYVGQVPDLSPQTQLQAFPLKLL